MINGLTLPTEGEVSLAGRLLDWREIHEIPEIRRKIGYVIQQGGLFPHLTVFQNISLTARLSGWEKERQKSRVLELLDLVNLGENFLGRYPWELSGGEQQRVGIARALMLDPPILLMDEPFGALDPITRRELQKEFLNLKKRLKKTVVLVTHDLGEAVLLADRIAVMDRGKVLQVGTSDELRRRPATSFISDFFRDIPQ
jgi:osmoprotectant transport system ATP-binding protein